jgi:hypothetical protein
LIYGSTNKSTADLFKIVRPVLHIPACIMNAVRLRRAGGLLPSISQKRSL